MSVPRPWGKSGVAFSKRKPSDLSQRVEESRPALRPFHLPNVSAEIGTSRAAHRGHVLSYAFGEIEDEARSIRVHEAKSNAVAVGTVCVGENCFTERL